MFNGYTYMHFIDFLQIGSLNIKYLCLCVKQLAFRFLWIQISKGSFVLLKHQNELENKGLEVRKPVQTTVVILKLEIKNHSGHLVGFVPILLKHFKDLVSYIGAKKQTAKMKNRKQKLDSDNLQSSFEICLYYAQKHTRNFIATNRKCLCLWELGM